MSQSRHSPDAAVALPEPEPSLSPAEREEGLRFAPRFDEKGLLSAIAVDDATGEVLMLAHMNAQALAETLKTGIAHYWSRSRAALWKKGETSGQLQAVVSIAVDCDQDALLLRVRAGGDGGACHTGRKSCFYRAIEIRDGGRALRLL